jgi:transcription antitermination factor NusG
MAPHFITTDAGNSSSCWFAVFVKARAERSVAKLLKTKGYDEFVPTYKEQHQWSDRQKQVDIPLFTRYVFSRFDSRIRLPVLTTPGVLSIVGTQAGPIPIEQYEIDALKRVCSVGAACEPWPYMQAGQTVRVRRGLLCGVEGLLIRCKKGCRVVLSVTLLQRSVAVEVDADSVECVPDRSASVLGSRR